MGIALLSAQTDFRFRIDPEEIQWNYKLNTHTDNTYGGKVIQILSISIDEMTIPVVSGKGGRDYLRSVASFFKDMMIWQRDSKQTATFTYSPRGYILKVYASNLKISDSLQNVVYPFSLVFQVQEDLAGVVKQQIMMKEIADLQNGIGYTANQFNDPGKAAPTTTTTTTADGSVTTTTDANGFSQTLSTNPGQGPTLSTQDPNRNPPKVQ